MDSCLKKGVALILRAHAKYLIHVRFSVISYKLSPLTSMDTFSRLLTATAAFQISTLYILDSQGLSTVLSAL